MSSEVTHPYPCAGVEACTECKRLRAELAEAKAEVERLQRAPSTVKVQTWGDDGICYCSTTCTFWRDGRCMLGFGTGPHAGLACPKHGTFAVYLGEAHDANA